MTSNCNVFSEEDIRSFYFAIERVQLAENSMKSIWNCVQHVFSSAVRLRNVDRRWTRHEKFHWHCRTVLQFVRKTCRICSKIEKRSKIFTCKRKSRKMFSSLRSFFEQTNGKNHLRKSPLTNFWKFRSFWRIDLSNWEKSQRSIRRFATISFDKTHGQSSVVFIHRQMCEKRRQSSRWWKFQDSFYFNETSRKSKFYLVDFLDSIVFRFILFVDRCI